jgi:hypothetical protein
MPHLPKWIGKPSTPRGRTAIPITQPTNHHKTAPGAEHVKTTPEQNKAIVLKASDTLFNERDYAAAERFWSPKYIQHSAPGREGLFALIRSAPDTLRSEN